MATRATREKHFTAAAAAAAAARAGVGVAKIAQVITKPEKERDRWHRRLTISVRLSLTRPYAHRHRFRARLYASVLGAEVAVLVAAAPVALAAGGVGDCSSFPAATCCGGTGADAEDGPGSASDGTDPVSFFPSCVPADGSSGCGAASPPPPAPAAGVAAVAIVAAGFGAGFGVALGDFRAGAGAAFGLLGSEKPERLWAMFSMLFVRSCSVTVMPDI